MNCFSESPLNPTIPRLPFVRAVWRALGLPPAGRNRRQPLKQLLSERATRRRLRLRSPIERLKEKVSHAQRYQVNLDDRRAKDCAASREKRAWLDAIKAVTPCKDCGGIFHPACMDYDHVRGEKIDNVSNLATRGGRDGKQKALLEIEKCELICANCHRIRTLNRPQKNRKYGKTLPN